MVPPTFQRFAVWYLARTNKVLYAYLRSLGANIANSVSATMAYGLTWCGNSTPEWTWAASKRSCASEIIRRFILEYQHIIFTISLSFFRQKYDNIFHKNALLMSLGSVPYLLRRSDARQNKTKFRHQITQNNSIHY